MAAHGCTTIIPASGPGSTTRNRGTTIGNSYLGPTIRRVWMIWKDAVHTRTPRGGTSDREERFRSCVRGASREKRRRVDMTGTGKLRAQSRRIA